MKAEWSSVLTIARLMRRAASALPGRWAPSNCGGGVVSDAASDGVPGSDERQYYGGHLIGESMGHAAQLFLVLAQPRHVETVVQAFEGLSGVEDRVERMREILRAVVDDPSVAKELAEYGLARDDRLKQFPSLPQLSLEEWRKRKAEQAAIAEMEAADPKEF